MTGVAEQRGDAEWLRDLSEERQLLAHVVKQRQADRLGQRQQRVGRSGCGGGGVLGELVGDGRSALGTGDAGCGAGRASASGGTATGASAAPTGVGSDVERLPLVWEVG